MEQFAKVMLVIVIIGAVVFLLGVLKGCASNSPDTVPHSVVCIFANCEVTNQEKLEGQNTQEIDEEISGELGL